MLPPATGPLHILFLLFTELTLIYPLALSSVIISAGKPSLAFLIGINSLITVMISHASCLQPYECYSFKLPCVALLLLSASP